MSGTSRAIVGGLAVYLALAPTWMGCARRPEPEPPPPPEAEIALELFRLARQRDPSTEQLAGVVQEDLLGADTPALLDTLDALRELAEPTLVRVEPLAGLDRAVVDLDVALAGEGTAQFSIQTARQDDGTWRVTWVGGPGLAWPHHPTGRGTGLSTSPVED